ncbi:P-loop containing nucleoside triphosphate hydrolase protein [Elaphomyces granulatus]
MMHSKPSSSMQKTYDECYLSCSTAVYFEGQNNEIEALRSWRSALETIYYHNAYRVPPNYVPKTETEKVLQESIRQLELQCKERVDLLEALQESRKEVLGREGERDNRQGLSRTKLEKGKRPLNETASTPGWIGDGTVPALDYLDLSRPPPIPEVPMVASRSSWRSQLLESKSGDSSPTSQHLASPLCPPTTRTTSHGSSPERRKAMLTTLRQRDPKRSLMSKLSNSQSKIRPAASKAADLAWNSTGRVASHERMPGLTDTTVQLRRQSTSSEPGTRGDQEPSPSSSGETSELNVRNSAPLDLIPSWNWREPQHTEPSLGSSPAGVAPPLPIRASHPTSDPVLQFPPITLTDTKDSMTPKSPSIPPIKPIPPPKDPSLSHEFSPSKHAPSDKANMSLNTSPSAFQTPFRSRTSLPKSSSPTRANPKPTNNISKPKIKGDLRNRAGRLEASTGNAGSPSEQSSRQAKVDSKVTPPSSDQELLEESSTEDEVDKATQDIMKKLPKAVDASSARQILNDIVVRGDEVHWDDIAGLEVAKKALKETVVYPFLRPDLFMGLREPARGMLLFGPPGTGKTMLARAVATESKSTFFSVSASSLTSKWHGESEKLVRALFGLAKALAPSIIFVDEIDSLLSARSSNTEHEASRRSKTEFLVQWSDLQRAAAGREQSCKDRKGGDASRVLVLAATNLPWDIDEAARRRFVRRQYIPLPEEHVREQQFRKLLSHQKHELSDEDITVLVRVTQGFSGSDVTALAKDAAMGPLRNLGEALLHTPMDQIRPIQFDDFEASLHSIRPSVNKEGLKKYEDWAKEFGERGG